METKNPEGKIITIYIPIELQKEMKKEGINISKFLRQAHENHKKKKWKYDNLQK